MKWIHLSDIHYNPKNEGRSTYQLRAKLPRYIADRNIKADYLFITGDFRHAKYQKDDDGTVASQAVQFILKIADAAKIDYTNIHVVPGNHDLTRTKNVDKISKIKKNYDPNEGRFLDSDLPFLHGRFRFYRQVIHELERRGVPVYQPSSQLQLHAIYETLDFSLLYLNTCSVCNSDNDRGDLIIGNFDLYLCLEKLKQNHPNKPVIVLAHHGMDNFRPDEKKAVERLFEDYPIKLYLCGDAHTPWRRSTNGIMEITMGCLVQGRNVRTVFSVGELENGKCLIKAHEWDADTSRWGEYTQLNDELRDAFGNGVLINNDTANLYEQLRRDFEKVRKRDEKNISDEAMSLAHKLWDEYRDGAGGIYLLDLARIRKDQASVEELYSTLSMSTDEKTRITAKQWYEKWGRQNEHY